MLKKILTGIVALVVLFVVVVMMQPSTYHIERSTQINAPAEVVWAELSDFNRWRGWNPWQKSDPEQKITITGTPAAVGHSSRWDGEKTGKGTMTISETAEPTRLMIRLHFAEPMESQANTAFEIEPLGEGVKVTWSMDGENDFMGKLFDLIMGIEDMIGSAYEAGLADLKTIAEASTGT